MTSFLDDSLQQNSDALQSALDSLNSAVSDSNFGYENHSNNPFESSLLTETTHSPDQSIAITGWQDSIFHNLPDPSLTQEINSWLDDDNSNNLSNLTPPSIPHVHYHPPHDFFVHPVYQGELQHLASSETHSFHSSVDVNVSGKVDHRHYWDKQNNSGSDGGDSNSSSYSNAPSSDNSNYCTDSNGDGVCDSSSGSCGDGGGNDSN